jgi:hypothetical protein
MLFVLRDAKIHFLCSFSLSCQRKDQTEPRMPPHCILRGRREAACKKRGSVKRLKNLLV